MTDMGACEGGVADDAVGCRGHGGGSVVQRRAGFGERSDAGHLPLAVRVDLQYED